MKRDILLYQNLSPVFFGSREHFHAHPARVSAMRNRSLRYAVLSLLVILLTDCARLPEYAKPRTIQIDEINMPAGFTYRPLKLEDFRATSLPANLSTHGESINAQSAITIRVKADSKFSIIRWPSPDRINYLGNISRLAFEAVMIPNNSWWNPKINASRTGYVLQHEQIHFAITELAARKLTSDARKWASTYSVIKETPQQVYSEIIQQIKAKIKSAMEANRKRHLKFDEDTSLFYNPSWQLWWLETVEKELKQTQSGVKGH